MRPGGLGRGVQRGSEGAEPAAGGQEGPRGCGASGGGGCCSPPGCRGADAGVAAGPPPWVGRGGLHAQGAVAEGGDAGKEIPSEHLAPSAGSLGGFGLPLTLRVRRSSGEMRRARGTVLGGDALIPETQGSRRGSIDTTADAKAREAAGANSCRRVAPGLPRLGQTFLN